jgi:hypothetical protein
MNDLTLLREAAPPAPPLTTAARSTARAALLAEIDGTVERRARPRRRTVLRLGAAVTAVAAAWGAAVVIAAPDPVGPLPDSVQLVAFEPPSFPLSLDPLPRDLTQTSFSQDPGEVMHASFRTTDGADGVALLVTPEEPEQHGVDDVREVEVSGAAAELVRGTTVVCGGPGPECLDEEVPYLHLIWERRDGQWVTVSGSGRFDSAAALIGVAEGLVDRPQPVPLQVHLAPAGWSVLAYKDDRILTLVDDAHEQHTVNVHLPERPIPADRLLGELMGPVGPVIEATVNGLPAQLVRTDQGGDVSGWYLQARFPGGRTFVVQAPGSFTQAQVLAFAGQVTHTP